MTQEIRITRRWVQIVNYRSNRFMWTYDYALNAGRPPAVEIAYGTCLTELRRRIRFAFPGAKVVMAWKES